MDIEEHLYSRSKGKVWQRLFIGILSLQAVLELGVGATLLFNFPFALENGFGIEYRSDLDILGIALGLYLMLLTTLMIISIVWTSKANNNGVYIGLIVGGFLVVFGLVVFMELGDRQGIIIDSIRGGITIVFGIMAGKEIQKQ